jgi:integral membrane protein (TIGR01906 family)
MAGLKVVLKWLFVLCLPVLLLSVSITAAANCPWLYKHGFAKYEVGKATGLSGAELDKVISGIIGYFNSGERDIDIVVEKDGAPFVLFNQREISHMRDVKGLIRLDYYLCLGTLVYALVFTGVTLFWWRDKKRLGGGLFWGGALTLGLMAALGLGALFDFESLFLQFHLISFDNYLWMLDPSRDYLIRLFPQGFYYDATLYCAAGTGAGALIMGAVGWWLMRKKGN